MTAILLLAVLAGSQPCTIQDENNGACGSLRERYDACVLEQLLVERVGDRDCYSAKEFGTWQERDECRQRLEWRIAPQCEEYETYRTDVVGYKPPRSRKQKIAACVEVRVAENESPRNRQAVRRQCAWKIRVDERMRRLKAGLPVATIPRGVADACRKASSSAVQRAQCCAKYGLGGSCK